MARAEPAGGAPNPEQRATDHATLTRKVAWLHTQADAVASTRPRLHDAMVAATAGSAAAAETELHDLGASADVEIASCREQIEHLAAELDRASGAHADRRELATGGLFHGHERSPPPAEARAPTVDQVQRLVADVSNELPGDAGNRCRARLPRASDSELTLLVDLVATGLTHDQLLRLLEGGHLLLPGHRLLVRWRSLAGVRPRTSSHYHPDDRRIGRGPGWLEAARARLEDAHARPVYGQQYGLKGKFVHEVLFGPGPHHTTFVQLERAAPSLLHLPRHIADWVRYRLTHRNQGPYGSSVDTDARPIRGIAWWKPSRRSAASTRLEEIAHETDVLVQTLLDASGQLDAQGRLGPMVWRGPAFEEFDAAVDGTVDHLKRAAAAVGAFAARLRREERVA